MFLLDSSNAAALFPLDIRSLLSADAKRHGPFTAFGDFETPR
jgi:hypothetical protein